MLFLDISQEPIMILTLCRKKNDYQNFIEIMKANGFYEIKMEYTTLNHTVWEDLKNKLLIYIVLNTSGQ